MREGFKERFEAFYVGCQEISRAHCAKHYPRNEGALWRVDWGQKRARVVRDGAAHCFVDYATGDVLKCDGWARPAKHARGNIFDEHNGLASMGPYGAAYLR